MFRPGWFALTMTPPSHALHNDSGARGRDGTSKSLIKGLAILGCFTSEHPALGIADIAERLQMSRSTTHRYACTLVELGYLEQDPKRRYRLGSRAADLGISAIASLELCRCGRPSLYELRRMSSGTVSLAILRGTEVICLERLSAGPSDAMQMITAPFGPGSRLPVHASAPGKLLAALLDPSEQGKLLAAAKLERLTPRTITSKKALRAQLAEIRQSGLALEDQELLTGVRSLACAIHGSDGRPLAAVGLSLGASRCSAAALYTDWSAPLKETARRISLVLGPGVSHHLRSSSSRTRVR
jgi:IclR family pca regulon transcriptional regulator